MKSSAIPFRKPILIVSDVDGTLLDDVGSLPRSPRELRSRIAALSAHRGAPVEVALASSRTIRELTVLQRALGIYGPCIAEDGALLGVDESGGRNTIHAILDAYDACNHCHAEPLTSDNSCSGRQAFTTSTIHAGRRTIAIQQLAADRTALEAIMTEVPAFHQADVRRLDTQRWRALGFRSAASVRRALEARQNSILLDPQALDVNALRELHEKAADHALQLRRGGRWLTLTAAQGKGAALRVLRDRIRLNGVSPLLAAIGNEENDTSLLAEADLSFVIRNPHRGPLESLASLPSAIVASSEGPEGWFDMLDYLHRMDR